MVICREKINDKDFVCFCNFVYQRCGITLNENKRDLVHSRLAKRLRALGFDTYSEYFEFLYNGRNNEHEIVNLLDAISTNVTFFFREDKHFDFLVSTLIPMLESTRKTRAERKIRIWSAGCSTGEEPYSLAITFAENMELKIGIFVFWPPISRPMFWLMPVRGFMNGSVCVMSLMPC